MLQTQTALTLPELYLNTAIKNSKTQVDSKIINNDNLYEFSHTGIFQLLACFNYNGKASMTFSISGDLKQHYILIKGLIVFCRSRELAVNFNAIEKTVTLDLRLAHLDLLRKLLDQVSTRLHDELRFKAKLKRILEFEKRYKDEARLVYQS